MQQAQTRRLLQQCGAPLLVWKTPRGVNDIIRQLALFLLLVRWSHVATWKHVEDTFHRKRGWCMQIYQEIFAQIRYVYGLLTTEEFY